MSLTWKEQFAIAKANAAVEIAAKAEERAAKAAAKLAATPYKKEIIDTRIVTMGGATKKATITLLEGGLKITSPGSVIDIPFETLSNLNFEDKTTDGHSMAGFGINWHDGESSAQVIFFENGWSPVRKARKAVQTIESAYKKFFAGCKVDPLEVIDVNRVREQAANEVVHRQPAE